jgi:hypothetical protein
MPRDGVLRSKNLYAAAEKAIDRFKDKISRWRRRYSTIALKPAKRLLPAAPSRQVRKELGFTPSSAATRLSAMTIVPFPAHQIRGTFACLEDWQFAFRKAVSS